MKLLIAAAVVVAMVISALPAQQGPLPPPRPAKPGQEQPGSDRDPVDVLVHLRDEVLRHATRIPNYTCLETVDRDIYQWAGEPPKSCDSILGRRKKAELSVLLKKMRSDRLRLDVLLTSVQEVYSWAGAGKFEDIEIDQLIPEGAMGTGPFATHLLNLFETRNPRFVFDGDASEGGRQLMEFSFTVPLAESHYRIKGHNGWVTTGYSGTLLVDALTSELVKLNVRTDELAPETGQCETDTELKYGKVPLGGIDYLLPLATRQRFIGRDGIEAENQVAFSACHEFRGESTLLVEDHGEGKPKTRPAAPPEPLKLPLGLPISIEILAEIHAAEAAAGDMFEARLKKPILDQRQKLLVAAGARIDGRLMRVELRHANPEYTVAMRLETIEIDGVKHPLSVTPNRRTRDLRTTTKGGLRDRGIEIELPLPSETHYGVYHFSGVNAVIPRGFETQWTTATP